MTRLHEVGEWLRAYGETIYGTSGSDFDEQDWGTSTHKDNRVFLPITKVPANGEIIVPMAYDIEVARDYATGEELDYHTTDNGMIVNISGAIADPDYIVEISLASSSNGIKSMTDDEIATSEYFNLQGMRVSDPRNGIYIEKSGIKVRKVLRRCPVVKVQQNIFLTH